MGADALHGRQVDAGIPLPLIVALPPVTLPSQSQASLMTEKIGVLFVHAQAEFGADAAVQADLVRSLDRDAFEVHVACTSGNGNGEPLPMRVMREIPRLRVKANPVSTLGRPPQAVEYRAGRPDVYRRFRRISGICGVT